MPNTRGFEMAAEVKEAILKEILRQAWKSGSDDSDEGVIPEHIEIPSGLAFGPYHIKDGTVQIPQNELDLTMNTGINGLDIKMGTIIHIEIDDPPVSSAKFFDITADITVNTPVRVKDDVDVYAILENLPANAITTAITSGNPIAAVTNATVEEYVHNQFHSDSFTSIIDPIPMSFGAFNMNIRAELYDDIENPSKKIVVSMPDANHVQLDIPVYIRIYDITGSMFGQSLKTPMGVKGTAVVIAPYTSSASQVTADFTLATVTLENIVPADDPTEGGNYTSNKNLASLGGFDLELLIKNGFETGAASTLKTALGFISVDIPQITEIESFISDQVRQELNARKNIFIWRPDPPEGSDQEVNDIDNQSLATALAIGINSSPGANLPAITDFIPAGRDFSIGLSSSKVMSELNKVKDETYPSFPHTFDDKIEGKTVKLNSLSFDLRNGAIGITGEVTVVDAIAGSIDVDASFDAEAILEWVDNADGSQSLVPSIKGDPDVDLDLLAWILSFLIGFITFGIIGGIIGVVIVAVVENVASKIGAKVAKDEATGRLKVLAAWPQDLDEIGKITARFLNPVDIKSDGIIFSGSMLVTSTYALTLSDPARSNGPYSIIGNQFVQFNGGTEKALTSVYWDFADGNNHIIRKPTHRYGKSGLYISKLKVDVTEDGGVATRHFAAVAVKNTAPLVSLPPDFTINEGEVFSITGRFTDENWLDTHSATVYFGDNSKAVDIKVKETHVEPMGNGEVCISHAYCDNGDYTLRLVVRDDVGGIGEASMHIKVLNMPPVVKLPERLNTLVGQPVRLKGTFVDPGWCDSHIGFWDLGDCTKVRRVVITEIHRPPELRGKAEIVHIFEKCGRFENILVITDDDNASGSARMIINANHVKNPDMKLGFRDLIIHERLKVIVANDWYPYYYPYKDRKGQVNFATAAKQDINQDGYWAQEIQLFGAGHAGIFQNIDVNIGWTYEFTGCYNFPMMGNSGNVRIGIDPLGGRDAEAPQIEWVEANPSIDWMNITVRAVAQNSMITLFIGVNEWNSGENIIRWDNVKLYQIQPCEDKIEIVKPSPCLNFKDIKEKQSFSEPFTHMDYIISPNTNQLVATTGGEPEGTMKLGFDRHGVNVKFPDYTKYVKILLANYEGRIVQITLLKDGNLVMQKNEILYNEAKEFEYDVDFVNELQIRRDSGKQSITTMLIKVCIYREQTRVLRELSENVLNVRAESLKDRME